MTIEFDGELFDGLGTSTRLVFPLNDELEGAASVQPVRNVLEAFSPILSPLAVDLILHAFKRDGQNEARLEHPCWFFVGRSAAARGVREGTGGAVRRELDRLDSQTLAECMVAALDGEHVPPDVSIRWRQIRVSAAEVLVPGDLAHKEQLCLLDRGGDVAVPVEHRHGASWARPYRSASPLTLQFDYGFTLSVTITAHWSIWAPGGPGAKDLAACVDALSTQGWLVRNG